MRLPHSEKRSADRTRQVCASAGREGRLGRPASQLPSCLHQLRYQSKWVGTCLGDRVFEEDNSGNLRICLAMAPRFCLACGDFHLAVAVRRSMNSKEKSGIDIDREHFVQMLAEALKLRRDWRAPLTVLIAGAADTAILKLILDAAMRVGGEAFARLLDLTVIDLCETPLEMCRVFAARHDLFVVTERADIGSFEPARRYGLVVMHGVLPFFPVERRLDYMSHIVKWLDREGLLVSSSQIAESNQSESVDDEVARHRATLETFLAAEASDVVVDRDAMFARLHRAAKIRGSYPRVFDDVVALQSFYSKAGLTLLNRHVVATGETDTSRSYTHRAVILGKVA